MLEAQDNGEDEVVPGRHHAFGQKRTGREILPQVPQGKEIVECRTQEERDSGKEEGISGELICSLTGVSRDGAAFAEIHNMGKPSQDDVENIAHHFSSGTFFWTDGTNCYDRLVMGEGRWIEEACHLGELRRIQPPEQSELPPFQDGGEGKEVPWGSGQVPSEIVCALGESAFLFRHGSFRQGEKCTGPL